MCGRTACSLCEDSLSKACAYKKRSNDAKCLPFWRDINVGHQYNPSYNQSPTQYLPVLLMASHIDDNCDPNERIFAAMRWGLIPSWHKNDPKLFKLTTINCKVEGIDERMWKTPFNKGFRCVVAVEGYFEWAKQTNSPKKQPYFFYFPQKHVSFKDRSWIERENELYKNSTAKWIGPRVLTLAAIFDRTEIDGKPLYSFAIVTVKSHKKLDWVHDRMPAILDGEEAVNKWLDYRHVNAKEAIKLLVPCGDVEWHSVTADVGNVRNNSINNVLPVKKQTTIENFFKPKTSAKLKNEVKNEPNDDKKEDDNNDDDDDDVKDEKDSNDENLKKRVKRKRKQK